MKKLNFLSALLESYKKMNLSFDDSNISTNTVKLNKMESWNSHYMFATAKLSFYGFHFDKIKSCV